MRNGPSAQIREVPGRRAEIDDGLGEGWRGRAATQADTEFSSMRRLRAARQIPGTTSNIDRHLLVAGSGVW